MFNFFIQNSDQDTLTIAQQVFSIFYAIFFGIMLSTIGARRSNPGPRERTDDETKNASVEMNFKGIKIKAHIAAKDENLKPKDSLKGDVTINLFDTPNAWAIGFRYDNKPFLRFLISLFFLNILPGFLFAVIFIGLKGVSGLLRWEQVLILVWISLLPQHIYRVFYALLVAAQEFLYLKEDEYPLYNAHDLGARNLLWHDRKKFPGHSSFINHIAFPIFFIFPLCFISYSYLLHNGNIEVTTTNVISGIIISLGLVFFIAPRKLT